MCVRGRLEMEKSAPSTTCRSSSAARSSSRSTSRAAAAPSAGGTRSRQRRARRTGRTRATARAGAARRRDRRAARRRDRRRRLLAWSRTRSAARSAGAGAEVRLGHRAITVDERADAITVGTDHGDVDARMLGELRRVAVGPGGGGRRCAPRPADRAVPRRVPRAGAERRRARPPPDLPGARPRPAVPRRAPVAWRRRRRPRRTQRGARTPAGGVLVRSRSRRRELRRLATFPGFWRMARQYWPVGVAEVYRSLDKRALAARWCASYRGITDTDLRPYLAGVHGAGGRARRHAPRRLRAREPPRRPRVDAPSPAATASLVIGASIARGVERI